MEQFQKWAEREYSAHMRLISFIPQGLLFIVLLPLGLVWMGNALESALQLPVLRLGVANSLIALGVAVPGFLFALWSIRTQFIVGRGTPMPVMPTQKLVIKGPYAVCRNPMAFGTLLLYFGLVVWTGSSGVLVVWLLFTIILLAYTKLIEEKELALRFGKQYVDYKAHTPFILPRFRRRGEHVRED
jgi:protein-S-isoprenylcysteine O-methyltransferase Ste14